MRFLDTRHFHSPNPHATQPIPINWGYVIYTYGCCQKNRAAKNCELLFFEYYDSIVVCRKGKGCKKGAAP